MVNIIEWFNKPYRRHLVATEVSYNEHSTLDVYAVNSDDRSRSAIILWHGGSWQRGDKATYRYVADYLARQTNHVIIVPNYQHYPVVKYPFFIDEAWQVVEWLQQSGAHYGINPSDYSIVGNSAGAHTATAVALNFRNPGDLPIARKCVSLAGPNYTVGQSYWPIFNMDHADHTRFPAYFATQSDTIHQTSFQIVHGRFDRIVSPEQSKIFVNSLQKVGAHVQVIHPYTGHIGLILGMGSPFSRLTLYAGQVVHFLQKKQKGPTSNESNME